MNEPELLRSAVHKTTSAIMTQKHAREIVQELHAAGYHISPVLFDPENDHLRSLLDEAIAALEPACNFAWTAVVADCDEARVNLNDIINNQRATITKLRAARNG
jgi:hypothetical protein